MAVNGIQFKQPAYGLFPLTSFFLILICLLYPAHQETQQERYGIESQWETLRTMAPQGLTLQQNFEPIPFLAGSNEEGEVVWRGALSSMLAPNVQGWSGPVSLAIAVSSDGSILDLRILNHSETPSFFRGLEENWFLEQFKGKQASSSLTPGEDIDGIAQASISVEAFCTTVKASLARLSLSRSPAQASPSLLKPGVYSTFCLAGALLVIAGKNRLEKRLVCGLIVFLIGFLSPQFASFIHLSFFKKFIHTMVFPPFSIGLFLAAAFFLSLHSSRGYCHNLCPAGQLQSLFYMIFFLDRIRKMFGSPASFRHLPSWAASFSGEGC